VKEIVGDLFEQEADALCITTNGYVNEQGQAVMGRGCAFTAAKRWPELPGLLGSHLQKTGNTVVVLAKLPKTVEIRTVRHLVAFPVKPSVIISDGKTNVVSRYQSTYRKGMEVPGWAAKANLELIAQSATQLRDLADQQGWTSVILPRPGCGYGELRWDVVKPLLMPVLDDRFACITWGRNGHAP
jgi:hypothetical protein